MLKKHSYSSPGKIQAPEQENTNKSADKHPIFFTPAVPTVFMEFTNLKAIAIELARQRQRERSALRVLRNVQAERKTFAPNPVISQIKHKP